MAAEHHTSDSPEPATSRPSGAKPSDSQPLHTYSAPIGQRAAVGVVTAIQEHTDEELSLDACLYDAIDGDILDAVFNAPSPSCLSFSFNGYTVQVTSERLVQLLDESATSVSA
jgi:hypothetical protein